MSKMSIDEINQNLEIIDGWSFDSSANCIYKEYYFSDFTNAVKFIDMIVPVANEMDHHPDLLLHSYNKLKVLLSTHSEKSVTEKDFILAKKIDNLKIK